MLARYVQLSSFFMTLAITFMKGHGLINKAYREHLLKEIR